MNAQQANAAGTNKSVCAPFVTPGLQRGAIGILGALVLVLLVSVLALVIDTARLYAEQRSLQGVTDAAALEAAQVAGLCSEAGHDEVVTVAQGAAGRNGYEGDLSDEPNAVDSGHIEVGNDGTRTFVAATGGLDPEAVQVTAHRTVPASIVAGGLWGEQVEFRARSTARRLPQGVLSVGSLLAGVDSQDAMVLNSVLNALIGGQLSLDAAGYSGLADARIRLGQLVDSAPAAGIDLSTASVDALLGAEITLEQALQLTVQAMADAGEPDPGLGHALAGDTTQGTLALEDVLVLPLPESAREARVAVLDLVSAVALRANRDRAVDVALATDLGVDGLASVTVGLELYIIEPPRIAVGPPGRGADGAWRTQAQTAQVRMGLSGDASTEILGLIEATGDLGTAVEAARGAAWLERIDCRTGTDGESHVAIGAQPGVASLALGGFSQIEAGTSVIDTSSIDVTFLEGLGSIEANLQAPGSDEPVNFADASERLSYTAGPLPQTQRTAGGVGSALGAGMAQLGDELEVEVTVDLLNLLQLGISEEQIANALISELLVPLLRALDTVLEPLLSLTGVQVGAVDVKLVDLEEKGAELVS